MAHDKNKNSSPDAQPGSPVQNAEVEKPQAQNKREIGGRKDGLEPTRYGDWEKNGRCIDF